MKCGEGVYLEHIVNANSIYCKDIDDRSLTYRNMYIANANAFLHINRGPIT
jgi:hypothetical protein